MLIVKENYNMSNSTNCPCCGGSTVVEVPADFRYGSGSAEVRRCLRCGHVFRYDDGCTG